MDSRRPTFLFIGAPCSTHTVSGTTDSGERPRRCFIMMNYSKADRPGCKNPGKTKLTKTNARRPVQEQTKKKQRTMTPGSTQRLSKQRRQRRSLGTLNDKVHYNKCYQHTLVDIKCTQRTRYHHPKENGPKKEVQGAALRLARKGKNFNFSRCQGEKCKIKNCDNDHYHACSCLFPDDKCKRITAHNLQSRLTKKNFTPNPHASVFVPGALEHPVQEQDLDHPYGTPCKQDCNDIKNPQINVLDIPVSSAAPDSKSEIFVELKHGDEIDAEEDFENTEEEEEDEEKDEKVISEPDVHVDEKGEDTPVTHKYPVGMYVRAAWRGYSALLTETYPARIRGHNADGSYDVYYPTEGVDDDRYNDCDKNVAEEHICTTGEEREKLEERLRKTHLLRHKPKTYKTSTRTLWYNPNAMEMRLLPKAWNTRLVDRLSQVFLRSNTVRTTEKTNFVGNKMVTCHLPGVLTPWKVAARTDEENIEYARSSIIGRVVSADKYSIAFHDNYVASREVTVFDALYDVLIMSVSGHEINTASEKNQKLSLVRAAAKAAIIRAYRTTCKRQMDKLAKTGSCDPLFVTANAQNPCEKGEAFVPLDRSIEEHAAIVDNTINVVVQYVHKRSAENLGLGVPQQ